VRLGISCGIGQHTALRTTKLSVISLELVREVSIPERYVDASGTALAYVAGCDGRLVTGVTDAGIEISFPVQIVNDSSIKTSNSCGTKIYEK